MKDLDNKRKRSLNELNILWKLGDFPLINEFAIKFCYYLMRDKLQFDVKYLYTYQNIHYNI